MNKLPEIGQYNVEVFDEDDHRIEVWSKGGVHHRVGKPAVIYYDRDSGKPVIQVYKQNGLVHRDTGLAHIQTNPENDIIHLEEHYRRGKLHRIGYEAVIRTNPETGRVRSSESYENGKRVDGVGNKLGRLGSPGFEL